MGMSYHAGRGYAGCRIPMARMWLDNQSATGELLNVRACPHAGRHGFRVRGRVKVEAMKLPVPSRAVRRAAAHGAYRKRLKVSYDKVIGTWKTGSAHAKGLAPQGGVSCRKRQRPYKRVHAGESSATVLLKR